MLHLILSIAGTSLQRERPRSESSSGVTDSATETMDTRRLVLAAREGDAEAREELAALARDPAYYFALQLLGNREDALDVSQEALIRFFGSLDRFQEDRPVLPWVRRIVRNAVIDLQRKKTVRRADSIDSDGFEGEALEIVDEDMDAAERAVSQERRRIIWRCLGRLPETHREIVVMREYQDLSYQEIADLLEVPIGTVMSRLHRARIDLRSRVLEDVEDGELEGLL